ncbi:AraC family transcriptional regulator [Clostridium neonatale]|uniref:AraC family transcriptional regulator n=2 Tax=Clostridiaceae TaxID=31979 RepID=A0A2A7MGH4_9CLOT|nr:AraC family transcriptional regulator [Clostridium neonatale]PEG30814.1 AraC family transcriptional regulator [Clostridium neonatale]CAH0436782.1 Putative transcriptional regulator, AraC domain [Clostridium neonatale]
MYDAYDSDSDFFSNEITFLLEQKDRNSIIYIIEKKHKKELMEKYFPINNKRNDLLIWNVVFIREIIKNGSTKQFIHTLYNKYYRLIQTLSTLSDMQKIELEMANVYLDILINSVEITNNLVTNKIIAFLYIHLEDHLNLEDLASELNLSISYMSNCFKKNMGISIMKYYKKIKINRAKTLIKSTDKSILEISTTLSFCDQCNFSKIFKDIVGCTPIEYRNNYMKKDKA